MLIHYSPDVVRVVRSIPVSEQGTHYKPNGLWLSVEGPDDWESWCRAEDFRLENLANRHEVVLSDFARIHRIRNAQEIDAFSARYSAVLIPGHDMRAIDWKKVAEHHDGIIIAPYIWERRISRTPEVFWYYSWDCASGCIWNAKAVESIQLLPNPESVSQPTTTPDRDAATPDPSTGQPHSNIKAPCR